MNIFIAAEGGVGIHFLQVPCLQLYILSPVAVEESLLQAAASTSSLRLPAQLDKAPL